MNKKIVIYGGGTINHVRNHFAFCAPAYGQTARQLAELAKQLIPNMDVDLILTRMAGGPKLETNLDLEHDLQRVVADPLTKVVIMSAALCDFTGQIMDFMPLDSTDLKHAQRLNSKMGYTAVLTPANKIITNIRKERKDIFLVGFKTTTGVQSNTQYLAGLDLCKRASCNLVLANDVVSRLNMVVCPEEARYHESTDRAATLRGLMEMIFHRTHLTFTRSTIVDGKPISWDSFLIPESLRTVVNHCIAQNAYRPFNGITAGHFAHKLSDTEFLTSIRKTNFNRLAEVGLVKIKTDGPDTVLAYGAKPSVGGQSQRIVFSDHPGLDCIVHFHCPIRQGSEVPTVSQREFECGSHECGQNTSKGLKKFGNLWAVYLENHGPNIVFNKSINPQEVIDFIHANFDLEQKTGGYVTLCEV